MFTLNIKFTIDKYCEINYICNMIDLELTPEELNEICNTYGLLFSPKYGRLYIQAIGLFRPSAWFNEFGTGSWNSFVHFRRLINPGTNNVDAYQVTMFSRNLIVDTDCKDLPYCMSVKDSRYGKFYTKEQFIKYLERFIGKVNKARIQAIEKQKMDSLKEDF